MGSEIFGPVESRRLGNSLGINHLPMKVCSYSCVYCQIGRTRRMSVERKDYGDPGEIPHLTEKRLEELSRMSRLPDTLTLVPNGEPTLDTKIADIIHELKSFAIPIAVITNASLLWQPAVRADLTEADIVSVKVDSTKADIWKKINRPHGSLELEQVLDGILEFANVYKGKIITETMLVKGLNDEMAQAADLAIYLRSLGADGVYLGLPLRPPAETSIAPPERTSIEQFIKVMKENGSHPVLLGDLPESEVDRQSGKIDELIQILKVHPLSRKEVLQILQEKNLSSDLFNESITRGGILEKTVRDTIFYAFNHEVKKVQ